MNHLARHHTVTRPSLPQELLAVVHTTERLQSEELAGHAGVAAQGDEHGVVLLQAVAPGEGVGQIYPDTHTDRGEV